MKIITVVAANTRQREDDMADGGGFSEVDCPPRNSLKIVGARICIQITKVNSQACRTICVCIITELNCSLVGRQALICKTCIHDPSRFRSHSQLDLQCRRRDMKYMLLQHFKMVRLVKLYHAI